MVTLVTCRNWHGWDICDFGGNGAGFGRFCCFRFRPGTLNEIFSGSLIKRSMDDHISRAAWFESKLNPMIFVWSKMAGNWKYMDGVRWLDWCLIFFRTQWIFDCSNSYQLISTWCGMQDQQHDNLIDCQWYPAIVQSTIHAPPIWMLLGALSVNGPILCHAKELECQWNVNANHFCPHSRRHWPMRDKRITVKREMKSQIKISFKLTIGEALDCD